MNREEFINECVAKTTLDKAEIEQIYDESLKYMSDRGLDGEEAHEAAWKRAFALLKRHLTSNAEKFEGFIVFAGQPNDYGAGKRYNELVAKWNAARDDEDAQNEMIAAGDVDAEGHPLHNKEGSKKQGKRISTGLGEMSRKVYMLAKRPGETDYQKSVLTLWRDKIGIDMPTGEQAPKINFRANVGQSDSEFLQLNSASVTEFTVAPGDEKCDVNAALDEFFKDNKTELKDSVLRKWAEDHTASGSSYANTFAIVSGQVMDVVITAEDKRNNIVKLVTPPTPGELFTDEELIVTCWVPKAIPINFVQGEAVITAIGQIGIDMTKEDKTQQISINVEALNVPEKYIVERAEEISKDKEQVEEDTDEKHQNLSGESM